MSDSILNSCDPIKTLQDAQKPVITMLLPVTGLRHDENGDLTADAIQTIIGGIKNMGVSLEDEASQVAVLMEAKQVLCNLNAQYEFLLTTMFTSIRNSETISKSLIDSITAKNAAMRDIIYVSRQILQGASRNGKKFIEGFLNASNDTGEIDPTLEAFQSMGATLRSEKEAFQSGNYSEIQRKYDVSVENNKGVSANLTLYSFLNIIAVGLLFYIVSVK